MTEVKLLGGVRLVCTQGGKEIRITSMELTPAEVDGKWVKSWSLVGKGRSKGFRKIQRVNLATLSAKKRKG